ncbi:GCN5-like N-acetyltransferase [Paenibacillus mucilaginosus 3016]|uniref:GCN5-like N-acetyltransferase n=2 Tax=Paenibacillus mucilaginosus TaxID=61624 RepID=H6NID5_9BACL|nr:GNAT family N-acetyltransferase [Paenibacillus mucilaginosus]AFC31538.1 GCN5-like N-acetyltransferase [Paenibacillus mucilaginosus 3016]AFH63883.1 GCN5 family N-acetyltransferase [Paenibacillus mucilaginosus K02]WFA20078.1 GNAT family N-acetyltransferase [Paenibacillus mucilaginosus]
MSVPFTLETISSLDPGTREGLVDLLIAVVDGGASVGFVPPLQREEAGGYWDSALGPGVHLWVARAGGRIAGTVQLQLAGKANAVHRAEIAKLMVHPDYRRHGMARILMQEAERKAAELGRELLVLDTREGDPSNDLYRSLGWTEAGRIPQYAISADGRRDATVYYYKLLAGGGTGA